MESVWWAYRQSGNPYQFGLWIFHEVTSTDPSRQHQHATSHRVSSVRCHGTPALDVILSFWDEVVVPIHRNHEERASIRKISSRRRVHLRGPPRCASPSAPPVFQNNYSTTTTQEEGSNGHSKREMVDWRSTEDESNGLSYTPEPHGLGLVLLRQSRTTAKSIQMMLPVRLSRSSSPSSPPRSSHQGSPAHSPSMMMTRRVPSFSRSDWNDSPLPDGVGSRRSKKPEQLREQCLNHSSAHNSRPLHSPKTANQLRQLVATLPPDRPQPQESEMQRQKLIARGESLLTSMSLALEQSSSSQGMGASM